MTATSTTRQPQAVGIENLNWRELAASALDWWQVAGVDSLVDDHARDWLAAPIRPPAPVAAPVTDGALPRDWAAFAAWRTGPDAPDAAWGGVAVAASGPATAPIMVLADCPDDADGEGGALLGGEAGRLFDRMLAAIGLERARVHLAAVCARRPRGGKVPGSQEERLFAAARHHIGLVAPERLLLIGGGAARAILGQELVRARGGSHTFNHDGREVAVVATHHPRMLLRQPALKADAWRDLQLFAQDLPGFEGLR